MRRALVVIAALSSFLLAAACESRNPLAPSSSALDELVLGLRNQGLTVDLAGEIRPEVNGFFSVPAQQVRVNAAQVNAFEYPSAEAAAAEARQISAEAQPGLNIRITWVSTPRFYRRGSLIVLYVGCSAEIVRALEATVGAPLAVGPTPCTS